jgi:protein involved in polysaccharide export with SLBB domain
LDRQGYDPDPNGELTMPSPIRRERTRLTIAAVFFVAACVAMYLTLTPRPQKRPGGVAATPSTQPGTYYVGGNVKRPGAYTSNGGTTTTVRQALIAAGGADDLNGARSFVTIHRRHLGEADEIQMELVKINLRPLLEQGVNDEPVWPNDQIMVHDKQ